MTTSVSTAIWPSFWARLFAWVIDWLVLSLVCLAVGWLAFDYVSSWGASGRLFGLVLATVYLGVTASALGGQASIGMRVFKLKVVSLDGGAISLSAALGRALLLVSPILLNGWFFNPPNQMLAIVLGSVLITVVFGVGLAQIYLLLFNRPTRRLFHDLVFRSAVVRAGVEPIAVPLAGKPALIASILILAVFCMTIAGALVLRARFGTVMDSIFAQQKIINAVNALPEFISATSADRTTSMVSSSGPPTVQRTLLVTARARTRPTNIDQNLAKIGAIAVKTYKFAPGQKLVVQVSYGFDLGFANHIKGKGAEYSTNCTSADVQCLVRP